MEISFYTKLCPPCTLSACKSKLRKASVKSPRHGFLGDQVFGSECRRVWSLISEEIWIFIKALYFQNTLTFSLGK